MRRNLSVVVACVLVVAGCSSQVSPAYPDVAIVPDAAFYTAGGSVNAQLSNQSDQSIGIGACSLHLEHLVQGRWIPVGPIAVTCIDIMYVVGAGSTRPMQLRLDSNLDSGTYRLQQTFYPGTSLPEKAVYSSEFRIQRSA